VHAPAAQNVALSLSKVHGGLVFAVSLLLFVIVSWKNNAGIMGMLFSNCKLWWTTTLE
jgi:hypothetical protein